jgi:nitrite reductase/ring-hydroxylating ferredoxin subunit
MSACRVGLHTRQLQPHPLSATEPPPVAPSWTAWTCPAAGPSSSAAAIVGCARAPRSYGATWVHAEDRRPIKLRRIALSRILRRISTQWIAECQQLLIAMTSRYAPARFGCRRRNEHSEARRGRTYMTMDGRRRCAARLQPRPPIVRRGRCVRYLKLVEPGCAPVCNRRELLGGAIASVALACSSSSASPQSFGDVPAGTASALEVGSIEVVPGVPACVARDAGGIYAMTLTCTHAGCDIATDGTVSASGIECGCHGSEFNPNGDVVRGPATAPLEHFGVSADAEGNLTVHGETVVASSTRLSV